MVPENTAPVVSKTPGGPWAPVAPAAPVAPVAPWIPWMPVVPWMPWIPCIPWSPCGPLNAPTLTHPFASVELGMEATHRFPSITYPSPVSFVPSPVAFGSDWVSGRLPLITMVPGSTPPILEPAGIVSDVPLLLSSASPRLIVLPDVKISFA